MTPEFSVIIPFKIRNAFLDETLAVLKRVKGVEFEVILLPDEPFDGEYELGDYPLSVIPTGEVSPAIKRDLGAQAAQGAFLAFIDDDAYPADDWLIQVKKAFDCDEIVGVGGPQVTPSSDPFWAKVSGAMFLSCLNGSAVYRYRPSYKQFDVDDWPTVNLCVRKDCFFEVGGFDSSFWPGEDTKLCRDLTRKQGKRIAYCGKAVVYHHRRSGFRKHMRQVGGYGLHRGYFARKFPETSFRLMYFVPSFFFLFVVLGFLGALVSEIAAVMYVFCFVMYFMLLLISLGSVYAHVESWSVSIMSQCYLVCTHFWYGFRFLAGFVSQNGLRHALRR